MFERYPIAVTILSILGPSDTGEMQRLLFGPIPIERSAMERPELGTTLIIDDASDMLALHRALLEAKFHPPPNSEDVVASPIISRIADAAYDAIVTKLTKEGELQKAAQWTNWRNASGRKDISSAVLDVAKNSPRWAKMKISEKREFIRCCFRPFDCDADVVDDLIRDADQAAESSL